MAAKTTKRLTPTAKRPGGVTREKIYLTYPVHLIKEPLIYEVGRKFTVVTNIRGANISDTMGLVALELDGPRAEIGARGQEQLLAAAVAVIGGGAVGATAVAYLAAAGVGRIDCFAAGTTVSWPDNAIDDQAHALRLVDDLNPDVEVSGHSQDAIAAFSPSSASRYDAILVATADTTVRERAAAAAVAHHVPVVVGVASGGTSWMGVFRGDVSTGPCPGCAVPETSASAASAWLGETAATLIGALAALEVILLIIGKRTPPLGRVLHFDAAASTICEQPAVRGAGCVVCAAHGAHS